MAVKALQLTASLELFLQNLEAEAQHRGLVPMLAIVAESESWQPPVRKSALFPRLSSATATA